VLVVALLLSGALVLRAPDAAASLFDIDDWKVARLDLPTNDAAFSPLLGAVVATVPSFDPALGNELVEVDPNDGTLRRHVWVGSDPTQVAVSDDGTTAYVVLRGANRVVRVDLLTFTVVQSFPVALDPSYGPLFVDDIEVLPLRNDAIAVLLAKPSFSPRHEGVWIYVNGVALPQHTDSHLGPTGIEFTGPTTIVGLNGGDTSFSFHEISVGPLGATQVRVVENVPGVGFGVSFEESLGRLYTHSGMVLDPAGPTVIRDVAVNGRLEVTPLELRVTYVSGQDVKVFSTLDGSLLDEGTIPGAAGGAMDLVATLSGFAIPSHDGLTLVGPQVRDSELVRPAVPPSTVAGLELVEGPDEVRSLVFEPVAGQLHVGIAGLGEAPRIAAIDPATGTVLRDLAVPAAPISLAVADDGSLLYAGLDDGTVAQIDLESFVVVDRWDLFSEEDWPPSPVVGRDLAVRPGHPDTVVVARDLEGWTPRSLGVVSYVDGVEQPGFAYGNLIEFGDADTLYGSNTQISSHELYEASVGADGSLTPVRAQQRLMATGNVMEMAEGLLYTDAGAVADPTIPELKGDFTSAFRFDGMAVAPDAARLYATTGNGLHEYDLDLMRPIDELDLLPYSVWSLVDTDVGFAGIATIYERNDYNRLVLLRPPPPPSIDELSPSSGPASGGSEVVIRGSDLEGATEVTFGSAPATSFTVVSDRELRAIAPPGAVGSATVTVRRGTDTSFPSGAATFRYLAEPPFVPLHPARLLDTRPTSPVGVSAGPPSAGKTTAVPVLARAGVPATGVAAVALSVTATQAVAPAYLTVWPCGQPRPGTSNLNVGAGQTVANLVVTAPGAGSVCVYTSAATHVIVDVTGWIPSDAGFNPVPPARLRDTRAGGAAAPRPQSVVRVRVAGRGGVPTGGVGTVALNVTATGARGPGFVTAWPCGVAASFTSNLNLERAGQTVANLVVTGVGTSGEVCLFTSGGAHLVVDVVGWWWDGAMTRSPERILDTRADAGQIGYAGASPAAGRTVELQVSGRGGVPTSGARSVLLNVTATGARGAGYVTVWPCGRPRPSTSNLNVDRPGQTVAVLVATGVGAEGRVCLYTRSGVDLVADLVAWMR
jgi:hypothetical protein